MSEKAEELLEHAAKAAGARLYRDKAWPGLCLSGEPGYGPFTVNHDGNNARAWNPLADDGDALRLSSELGIDVTYCHSSGVVTATEPFTAATFDEPKGGAKRAIVRAAAELGKRMTPIPLTAQGEKP